MYTYIYIYLSATEYRDIEGFGFAVEGIGFRVVKYGSIRLYFGAGICKDR